MLFAWGGVVLVNDAIRLEASVVFAVIVLRGLSFDLYDSVAASCFGFMYYVVCVLCLFCLLLVGVDMLGV